MLIEGDTGTGKELMAKALHDLSTRREKPFVAINCGALPDTLLESELFGYKAGAFTNAVGDKPGYFTLADGGTILLDELGETSPAFQVKLLRVLEEHEFHPLGGIEKQRTNVRILAATNRDLEALVEQGKFRRDLFYRINIVRLQLPSLRERKEDIPLLIERFIDKMNRLRGKAVTGIEPAALERLMAHEYPGNIRELENIIEHAFILCSQGTIGSHHLPAYLLGHRRTDFCPFFPGDPPPGHRGGSHPGSSGAQRLQSPGRRQRTGDAQEHPVPQTQETQPQPARS